MQAFVIILLGLGFTAGVVFSSTKDEQDSVKLEVDEKKEVVHIESALDTIDDNHRDSIFPIL